MKHYKIPTNKNQTPFTVFFDMDGVLADFEAGIYQYMMNTIYYDPADRMGYHPRHIEIAKLVNTEIDRIRNENNGVFSIADIKDKFNSDLIKPALMPAIDDGFFYNLLPLCDGLNQLAYTKSICDEFPHISMAILSSAGKYDFESAVIQKTSWLEQYVEPIVGSIPYHFTKGSAAKGEYVQSPNDILLDDRQKCIDAWEKAGGIGVLWE